MIFFAYLTTLVDGFDMKKFFCVPVLLLLFLLSCKSTSSIREISLEGDFTADIYGDTVTVTFANDQTAVVTRDGETCTARYFERDGIIEVWQERKTPALFLKQLNENELLFLNAAKNETDIILKRK